jgi:uncharacterized protein YfaP (DUF2135 family)
MTPAGPDRGTALIDFVDGASKAVFTSAFPQAGTYMIHASYQGMSGTLTITASKPQVEVNASEGSDHKVSI